MSSTLPAATAPAAPAVMPWLSAALTEALRSQRGHALLVHGPDGGGQFEFAIALARAWLCETPAAARPHGLACGCCESCHLATADQVHPDLCVLMPDAMHLKLGWRQKTDEPQSAEGKKKPSEWISVDQVRAAIAFSSLTRGRGQLKVVVINPAERLPQVAASALLKLLEEPQGGQRFVLASGDAGALMATVRSRCHAVALPAPDPAEAARWLAAAGLADAAVLLAASGGQPLAALERQALGLDGALWARLPALVLAGDSIALSRLPVALLIESLQKLCHDAMLGVCGVAPRFFPPGSVPPVTSDLSRLTDWAQALRRIARHADHPWKADLMVESLVLQGREALAAVAPQSKRPHADSVHSAR